MFGKKGADIILALDMDEFFGSVIFLIPVSLFTVNLTACTVKRFLNQLRGGRRNFAPDIIHVGLMVLVLGGVFSSLSKQEGVYFLAPGETLELPEKYSFSLLEFRIERYPDGSIKDWISYIKVYSSKNILRESYPLEVNRPLRLGRYRLYQYSYIEEMGRVFSGIKVVSDPGYGVVLAAFMLVGIGLVSHYILKFFTRRNHR
jgi:cytochrome c biogenesis protein